MIAPAKNLWPRYAVSPEGGRARFGCMGDVPHGWTLEVPLPGDTGATEEPFSYGLALLREKYHDVFGKKPGPKWDAETLRKKIAEGP